MANTKISHLGSRDIAISGLGEIRFPALGNAACKPGDLVGIVAADGKVKGSQIGTSELFRGILDDLPTIAENTAIPAGTPCSVIIPQPGHRYRVQIEDIGATTFDAGQPMGFSSTIGAMEDIAGLGTAGVHAVLNNGIVQTDTVAEITWIG